MCSSDLDGNGTLLAGSNLCSNGIFSLAGSSSRCCRARAGEFQTLRTRVKPRSNLADHLLFAVNSSGEVTIAGGTGNGYMLSQLRGAVNPNGWSGVIEVKSPAGVTAGYLLLYTNP